MFLSFKKPSGFISPEGFLFIELNILSELTLPLQILLSKFPLDSSIIPRVQTIKKLPKLIIIHTIIDKIGLPALYSPIN